MKRVKKGRVFVTASLVRRLVTIALILLIGAGTTTAVIAKVNKEKTSEKVLDNSKTLDSQNKQIKEEDLENEEEKENKIILFNDLEEEITWDQDYPSSPSPAKVATVSIKPGPAQIDSDGNQVDIAYDTNKHVLSTLGAATNGTMMYYVSESKLTPDKSLFEAYDELLNPEVLHKTACGKYYIWFYAKGDAGYNDSAIDKIGPIVIKGDPVSLDGLLQLKDSPITYTGEDITFIIQGFTTNPVGAGTVKYAFGKDLVTTPDISEFIYTFDTLKAKDEGLYYIWYFVDGDESHDDTEPIQFDNPMEIAKETATYDTPVTPKQVAWNGNSQILVIPPTGVSEGCTVKYAVSDTKPAAASSYSITLPSKVEPKAYKVWWYIDGGVNYRSTEPEYVMSSIVDTSLPKARITKSPKAIDGLSYNNQNLVLVEAGESDSGIIKYSFGTQVESDGQWTTNVSSLTKKDAGTYYIWYYIDGQGTHQDSDQAILEINIRQDKAVITNDPTPYTDLISNGSNQELVRNGSSNTGLFKYAITTDSNEPTRSLFSSEIPTAKDVGTYKVWYFAGGNTNYGDSEIRSLEVVISGGKITYSQGPQPNNHLYTGTNESLVNMSGADGGTWMFAVTATSIQPSLSQFTSTTPSETDLGTYVVWYYLKGHDYFLDSDINHFEVTIEKNTSSITTEPQAINTASTGNPIDLLTNQGACSTGATMMYYVSSTNTVDESMKNIFKETVDRKSTPGTYYVYYYAKGNYGYTDSSIDYVTAIITGDKVINPPKSITSIGTTEDVDLLGDNAASFVSPYTGTIYYSITTSQIQPNIYSFAPKTNHIVSESGIYYIWYFARVNNQDGSTYDTDVAHEVSVVKRKAQVTSVPTIINTEITVPSSSKPFGEGFSTDGTMMYYLNKTVGLTPALNTNKALYSSTIPTITDSGFYCLNYYVKGDENHTDSDCIALGSSSIKATRKLQFTMYAILDEQLLNGTYLFDNSTENNGKFAPKQVITQAAEVDKSEYDVDIRYMLLTEDQYNSYGSNLSVYIDNYFGSFRDNDPNTASTDYSEIAVKKPGSYTLIYSSAYESMYTRADIESIHFTIKKTKAEVTQAPQANAPEALIHEEYSQNYLLDSSNMGQGTGSQMMYAVTSSLAKPTKEMFFDHEPYTYIPGTYYVWYYMTGNSIHEDSDICENPVEVTVTDPNGDYPIFTAPTPNVGNIYDGFPHLLVTPGTTDDGTFWYYSSLSSAKPAEDVFSEMPPSATNGGTYYVWYFVKGKNGKKDSDYSCIPVTIEKKDQTLKTLAVAEDDWTDIYFNLPLVKTEPTSTGGTTAEYYVSNSDVFPSEENIIWGGKGTAIANDPGVYYVWYRCAGNDNYYPTEAKYFTVIIKGESLIDEYPTIKSSFTQQSYYYRTQYTGEEINPFVEGSGYSNTGELVYFVHLFSEDGPESEDDYSVEIPTIKEPGYYEYLVHSRSYDYLYNNSPDSRYYLYVDPKQLEISQEPSIADATVSLEHDSEFGAYNVYTLNYSDGTININPGSVEGNGTMKYLFAGSNDAYYVLYGYDEAMIDSLTIENVDVGTYLFGWYVETDDEEYYSNDNLTKESAWNGRFSMINVQKSKATISQISDNTVVIDDNQPKELITEIPVTNSGVVYYTVTQNNVPISIDVVPSPYSQAIPKRKDPGTYYVWYFSSGDANHDPSDIKGCKVVVNGSNSLPDVTVKANTYDGNAKDLIEPVSLSSETLYYKVSNLKPSNNYDEITSVYNPNDINNRPTATLPGTYFVSYYFENGGEKSEIHNVLAEIARPIGPGPTNKPQGRLSNLYYDSSSPSLLEEDVVDDNYYFMYAFSTSYSECPSLDKFSTIQPTYNYPGTYYIWWYAVGHEGEGGNYYAPTEPECFVVEIKKAQPRFLYDVQGRTDIFNNNEIDLVSNTTLLDNDYGSIDVLFYVTSDLSINTVDKRLITEYQAKATLPGTYKVFYYITGSDRFEESPVYMVTATIYDREEPSTADPLPVEGLRYNGTRLTLYSFGSTISGYNYKYALGTADKAPNLSSFETYAYLTGVTPGTYYIYYYIEGPNGDVRSDIKKLQTIISKSNSDISDIEFISDEFVATGNPLNIISNLPSDLDGRTIRYCVEDSSILDYIPDHTPELSKFSSIAPQLSDVGVYDVWYYAAENDCYEEGSLHRKRITINNPTGVLVPQPLTLSYQEGVEQDLIEAGNTPLGHYEYGIGSENAAPADYSITIPQATTPGKYYIYYRLISNSGSVGSPVKIMSTILKAPTKISPEATASKSIQFAGQGTELLSSYADSEDGVVIYYVTQDTLTKDEQVAFFSVADNIPDCCVFNPSQKDRAIEVYTPIVRSLLEEMGMSPEMIEQYIPALLQQLDMTFREVTVDEPGTYNIYYVALPDTYWEYSSKPSTYDDIPGDKTYMHKDAIYSIEGIEVYKPSVTVLTPPTAIENPQYNGINPVTLVNDGTTNEHGVLKYFVSSSILQPEQIDKTLFKSYQEQIPSAHNVGTYYVYYYGDGEELAEDSEMCPLTSGNPIAVTIEGDGPSIVAPILKESYVYNLGNNIEVFEAGNGATASWGDKSVSKIEYLVTGVDETPQSSYNEAIPTVTNAGKYLLWYRAEFTDGTNAGAESIPFEVKKLQAEFITAPSAIENCFYCRDVTGPVFAFNFDDIEANAGTVMYYQKIDRDGRPNDEDGGWWISEYDDKEPLKIVSEYPENHSHKVYLWYYIQGDENVEGTELTGPVICDVYYSTALEDVVKPTQILKENFSQYDYNGVPYVNLVDNYQPYVVNGGWTYKYFIGTLDALTSYSGVIEEYDPEGYRIALAGTNDTMFLFIVLQNQYNPDIIYHLRNGVFVEGIPTLTGVWYEGLFSWNFY